MGNVQQLRWLLLLGWLAGCPIHGAEVAVPEALRDWQQWVLKDKAYRQCPFFLTRAHHANLTSPAFGPGSLT